MERYYAILELEFPATRDEVKKAFRRLAHIHHPDKGGDANKFKEIGNAYHILIQRGYWDALVKEEQKGAPVQKATVLKFAVHFNDAGDEFWMEDEQGFVRYYWTADQTVHDAVNWRELDDSVVFKDYTKHIGHA